MAALNQFWTDYGALVVGGFGAFSVIVFLWALVDAFSSISRTMKEARKLWDESEQALHRFKSVIRRLEELETDRLDRNAKGAE